MGSSVKTEFLNDTIEFIKKNEDIGTIKSIGYDSIVEVIENNITELSLEERLEMSKLIISECKQQIKIVMQRKEERRNREFRRLSKDIEERRLKGEMLNHPKSFRYWYYYGENKRFLEWFHERLEESYIANDITMLACTVRDQFKKGLEKKDYFEALAMLENIDKKYELDALQDVKGIVYKVH